MGYSALTHRGQSAVLGLMLRGLLLFTAAIHLSYDRDNSSIRQNKQGYVWINR
ncbi:hypothetical protein [Paenibacillus woosongensis]|uniref:Uncharacterized protein n=1 Tax=Paenibacillus woosongensis TaxID=307580 RepID=A0A7X3CQ51_9BACL|nr:hypothetical protein [Paenibacillus woosongensis]MUG47564.1 hypothetical protein [Paenibacillus woosongensis]